MLNIISVATGILVFIYSITLFWRTYRVSWIKTYHLWWSILALLVVFFLLGYIAFEYFLITGRQIVELRMLVAQVFLWGSVFVLITARFFYVTTKEQRILIEQALAKLRKRDEEEKERMISTLDELERANEQLKKMDKTKDEFLSIVTHDLKTPLASVYAYTKLLLGGTHGELAEKQKSFLDNILRQSRALQEIIDSILDFTRMEFGKITLDREPFSLNLELAELIDEVQPLADQRGIALDVSIPEEELEVNADKRMIERVITNLLSNAVKYTPEKGEVAVSLDKDGEFARISVKDNGIGIKKEHLDRLFDKFFMVEAAKAGVKRSLGLGLHIAKSFVEAHGGRIWAESGGIGKGTKFIFSLPLA